MPTGARYLRAALINLPTSLHNAVVTTLTIALDDPNAADVQALLERHLDFARRHSPPEDVHALDTSGLTASDITFFSARQGGRLLGLGALKQIDDRHAEIKSMHTAEAARRLGVARAMLDHLLAEARARGCTRVSLETGSMDAFAPARRLYEAAGFVACTPFGGYVPSRNSTFLTLELVSS